jgi:hypothetical protein
MGRGLTHEKRVNATDEWYTPRALFDTVLPGVTFSMDVCSPGAGKCSVPAARHITAAENGLLTPWSGMVWCNPPYSCTGQWVQRMAQHNNGILLTFARTDAKWAQAILHSAVRVLFLKKRVPFVRPDGTSPGMPGAGSMLAAFGADAARILSAASAHGVIR